MTSLTTNKIFTNTFFQLAAKLVSMSITVLATVIITRMYGKQGYGEFSIMQNFPALFFIVVDFGLNAIATRELSRDWDKAAKYLGNILIIRTLMSLILMALCAVALGLFPYSASLKFGVYLSLFLILTQALYSTTNIIFQVKLRYDLSALGYIVGSFLVLALVLLLAHFNVSITWVNFAYVLGGVLTVVINLILIKSLGVPIKLSVDPVLWKYLFVQSLPLGLMFAFSQINFKADSLMLSVLPLPLGVGLNNTESVAIYSLPYKVFEVSLVIPTFFMNSVYPILVRHMDTSPTKLKDTFLKSFGALVVGGLIAGLLGYLFAPLVIEILGGGGFGQSVDVLRVLMLGLLVFYVTQPLAWLIVTLGKQVYLPGIYFISAIFNVTANYLFIPKHSFYASSFITILSETIILILLVFFALRAWKLKYA